MVPWYIAETLPMLSQPTVSRSVDQYLTNTEMPFGWYVDQAPVVEKIDSAIHWINRYPADNALTTYALDSNLSGG